MSKSMNEFYYISGRSLFRGESFWKFDNILKKAALSRNIKFKNGVFVVNDLVAAETRFFFLSLMAASIIYLLFFSQDESLYQLLRWYFDYDKKFHEHILRNDPGWYLPGDAISDRIYAGLKEKYKDGKPFPIEFLVFFVIGFVPYFLGLFVKRRAPVVFDKKRGVIYTLHNGVMFYAMVYDLEYLPFQSYKDAMENKKLSMPLVVKLYRLGDSRSFIRTTPFYLGAFYPDCPCQQQLLCITLTAYFSNQNKNTNDEWLLKLLEKKPNIVHRVLDALISFRLVKSEDPFNPNFQRKVDRVASYHKNLKTGDLDFPDFDFSIKHC